MKLGDLMNEYGVRDVHNPALQKTTLTPDQPPVPRKDSELKIAYKNDLWCGYYRLEDATAFHFIQVSGIDVEPDIFNKLYAEVRQLLKDSAEQFPVNKLKQSSLPFSLSGFYWRDESINGVVFVVANHGFEDDSVIKFIKQFRTVFVKRVLEDDGGGLKDWSKDLASVCGELKPEIDKILPKPKTMAAIRQQMLEEQERQTSGPGDLPESLHVYGAGDLQANGVYHLDRKYGWYVHSDKFTPVWLFREEWDHNKSARKEICRWIITKEQPHHNGARIINDVVQKEVYFYALPDNILYWSHSPQQSFIPAKTGWEIEHGHEPRPTVSQDVGRCPEYSVFMTRELALTASCDTRNGQLSRLARLLIIFNVLFVNFLISVAGVTIWYKIDNSERDRIVDDVKNNFGIIGFATGAAVTVYGRLLKWLIQQGGADCNADCCQRCGIYPLIFSSFTLFFLAFVAMAFTLGLTNAAILLAVSAAAFVVAMICLMFGMRFDCLRNCDCSWRSVKRNCDLLESSWQGCQKKCSTVLDWIFCGCAKKLSDTKKELGEEAAVCCECCSCFEGCCRCCSVTACVELCDECCPDGTTGDRGLGICFLLLATITFIIGLVILVIGVDNIGSLFGFIVGQILMAQVVMFMLDLLWVHFLFSIRDIHCCWQRPPVIPPIELPNTGTQV